MLHQVSATHKDISFDPKNKANGSLWSGSTTSDYSSNHSIQKLKSHCSAYKKSQEVVFLPATPKLSDESVNQPETIPNEKIINYKRNLTDATADAGYLQSFKDAPQTNFEDEVSF